jgi:hypothetical protein
MKADGVALPIPPGIIIPFDSGSRIRRIILRFIVVFGLILVLVPGRDHLRITT